MNVTPRTIQQVVSDNVRRLREERGVSQDDVARSAQEIGAPWRHSTVGDVENLRRVPTVETLVVLAAAFTALEPDRPVSPTDLLELDGTLEVTPGTYLPGDALRRMLGGAPALLLRDPPAEVMTYQDAADAYFRQPPAAAKSALDLVRDHYLLADERAARRLGLDDDQAQELMARFWGESLSSRSSWLAIGAGGEQPNAQRKGIVTRRLTQELEEGLTLMRALEAAGAEDRAVKDLSPERWSALASAVAHRRAKASGRSMLEHLGLDATAGQLGAERAALDSIPWATEELLAKLEEEADRGDDQ